MFRELISVIIPVHNGSRYIKRTLKNVLSQKECDLEVICVENFSNDNSIQIIERIVEKDERVKLFHSCEPGTSFARRLGVEKATGDYIIFCDQDDGFVDCYAISNMINSLLEDQVDICQFGYYKMYFPGIKKLSTEKYQIIEKSTLERMF